ncbi:MAG: TonB-dependent receptor [Arenicella sp.]|nr:TonB-dependent receptor [Arenicella sp.]
MKNFAVCVVSLICSLSAFAEQPAKQLEEVVVRSHLLSEGGAAQPLNVISGDELTSKVAGSLGETVATEPGISSASFGTAVGRPVIHGLAGARVKTTEDRIDSLDLATASADHAVTVEPFIANQITVLKGPSTLLYGSAAIGGVVDVETGRIARELPDQDLQGRVELRFGDNADAKTAAARLDGRLGENLVWHLDAFAREANDYDISGFVESAPLRASEAAGENGEEEEEQRDILESSFFDNDGVAFGASWISDKGFIGASISTIDSTYGLVGGHHHGEEEGEHGEEDHEEHGDEEVEEESGQIEMKQTRFDIEAGLNELSGLVESINFRLGVNDYEHQEIEGTELGTQFENDAWEGRLEFHHKQVLGFEGAFGVQLSARDYSAIGEEAFVAPVDSETQSLFWVGEREFDGFDLETGFRLESVEHDSSVAGLDKLDFSAGSVSIGVVAPLSDAVTVSALYDFSNRAPTIEELFSDGPHLATQSFEIGDLSLQEETANALSFTANYQSDWIDLNATAYVMDFDDFIYQAATGAIEDDLPVFLYKQDDARFTGLDLEAVIHLAEIFNSDIDLTLLYDTVDAEIDVSGNQNLPRIPASRMGVGLKWQNEEWSAKLNWLYVDKQDQVADFEFLTESYNDISLRINRRFEFGDRELDVFVHGKNLSDDEQRHHASFVKDFAPAPGRRIEAGIQLLF